MKKFLFLTIFAIILFAPFISKAGFGISPPYIKNDYLIPGSYFETTIYLVRTDVSEDMTIETIIEASEVKNWIIIDDEFIIPKGQQQFPMKVGINIPKSTNYGNYQGVIKLRVKKSPNNQIALESAIDIQLKVISTNFSDFKIKGVSVPYFEQGNPLFVLITLENIGNTEIKLSKVHLDIYDLNRTKILKSGDIIISELVKPFETKQIRGEMQVDLELGEYWADISIYKDEVLVHNFRDHFSIIKKEIEPLTIETRMERETPFINLIIFILSIILR